MFDKLVGNKVQKKRNRKNMEDDISLLEISFFFSFFFSSEPKISEQNVHISGIKW